MEDFEETTNRVQLHLYSLAGGEGDSQVWQVGLVAFGREYHLTDRGITTFLPSYTELGEPTKF